MRPYEFKRVWNVNDSSLRQTLTFFCSASNQTDMNYKLKLISTTDDWVESCNPNPCQYGGKCILSGKKQTCQCKSHFTGRFCSLTMCELDPCVFGQCELTASGFKVEINWGKIRDILFLTFFVITLSFSSPVSLPNRLPGFDVWSKAKTLQW
jgi:hypothetical protein